MVAREEAALDFQKRDVQLLHLALVSVFDWTWTVCGGFVGTVLPQSGQRKDVVRSENTYFSTLRGVACWRGERCLHFLDMIAFG